MTYDPYSHNNLSDGGRTKKIELSNYLGDQYWHHTNPLLCPDSPIKAFSTVHHTPFEPNLHNTRR